MTRKAHLVLFLGLLAIYLILAFSLPTDPSTLERLSITQLQARLLSVSILIPICLTYVAALFGFLRFRSYYYKIKKSKEGPPFRSLTTGLMILAYSLPIQSIMGTVVSFVRQNHPDVYPYLHLIRNYFILLFALVAIVWLSKGAEALYKSLRKSKEPSIGMRSLLIPIVLASVFSWLITSQGGYARHDVIFFPDWAQVVTIAIPYVYVWSLGFWTVYVLMKFRDDVKGVIYKAAFDGLAKGLGIIIIVSVFLQFLTVLSEQINRLDLNPLLSVLYTLVLLYIAGYGLIARGAGKLKKIEEV